ncbi:hypothetical protein JHJ32_22260, partial [Parapedobacter sp. ISTM3]|uniref:Ig-like domain-containing protein n=1 Tax=Parapedobacter sp. ISTM3 TaxID=2800130 RepID=UPI001A337BC2
MEHIFRVIRLGAVIAALWYGGFCAVPAYAQLTAGSQGLAVKAGTLISIDGLVLNPKADMTFAGNVVEESATPVMYADNASIKQVYTFGTPIPYSGMLRFNYRDEALDGAAPRELKLIYSAAEGGTFTLLTETVVNEANRVAEYEFEDQVMLQQVSALPLFFNIEPNATNMTHTVTYTEDPDGPVALNDIVVTDPNVDEVITATLTLSEPAAGALTTGVFGSATSTYNGDTGVWMVSGSVTDVNAALASVAFVPVANWDQNTTITTRIRDAADTGPADGTITLQVTAVNDAPVITAPGSITVIEDEASAITGISFSDVDAGTGLVTATFSVPSGSLAATSGGGVTVGGTASALTLTGTIADINAFIAAHGVTYTTALNATADVTLTVTINDNGNTGSGGAQEVSTTVTLAVNAIPRAAIVVDDTEVNVGETATVTITFSEMVTGLTLADFTVANGTLSYLVTTDRLTWRAIFTPAADVHEPNNVITLDNTGFMDMSGNTGRGTTTSNNFAIRTLPMTLVVTTLSDTGDDATIAPGLAEDETDGDGLSLREALAWARRGDTVTFAQGGTITLNGTQLVVNHGNLTIDGDLDDDGVPDITVSGNNASRIMFVAAGSTDVELVGLTLTDGAGINSGGGLALGFDVSMTLRNCKVTNNHELGAGGGGIYGSSVTLTLVNCTVSGNSSNAFGGGLRIVGAGGRLHLVNSTVSGNTTTGTGAHGGGIQFGGTGGLTIVNSTISGNAALGNASVGGGLRIAGGNTAVYNSTIVGNAAAHAGGGVSANGNDSFVNTVVAGNTAGAAAAIGGAPLATGGTPDDVNGVIETGIHNFFGTNTAITTDNHNLNNQGTDNLLLGDLMDNGGPVHTHKPQAGSALIGAGSVAHLPPDAYDLDGNGDTMEALPVDATGGLRTPNGTVDIGAVEAFQGPEVSAVGTTNPDGLYKTGDLISITVVFNAAVTVNTDNGSPTLLLETGDTDREAVYVSGSGSNTLTFAYTVQAGDASADLDYASTAALALNGGTIQNAAGLDAVLTLPATGGANSIAGQHAIVIDGVAPEVTSVAVPADGYHVAGDALDFTVHFSENVTVDATGGEPHLEVTIGTTVVQAGYVNGSGSNALVFRYVVQTGDIDLDGITVNTVLEPNGGTLRDAAGNDANTTLNNIAPTNDIFVHAVYPSVALATTATSPTNQAFMVSIVFSEAVTGLTIGGVSATNAGLSGLYTTDNLTYTVQVTPLADGVVTMQVPAGTAQNIAGNGNTVSNMLTVEYDGTAPAVPAGLAATPGNGEVVLEWTANSDDAVSYRVYGGAAGDPAVLLETMAAGETAFTHTGLANGREYHYRVSAVDAAGNESPLSEAVTATPMGEQVITFGALAAMTYGDGPLTLTAAASSGLEVTYSSSDPSVASVSGNVLAVHSAGTVTITAKQEGDAAFHAAAPVMQVLTVNPAALIITADAGQGKVYGAADPVLTFDVSGFARNDDESILGGKLEREAGEDAGGYAITQGTLTAGNNYAISFSGADFIIEPRTVTVTADGKSKVSGAADPALTYTAVPALVNGDAFTGTLVREPGEDAGNYAITQGTLTAGSNYELTFIGAWLVITQHPSPQEITGVTLAGRSFVY